MKKRKSNNKPITPKGIKIVELDDEYRFYKIWSGNKVVAEPFLITSDIEDVVSRYDEYCRKWNIKPDMELVYKLVNNNNQKKQKDESSFLKGGIF